MTMNNQPLHLKLLSFALIVVAISCIFYVMSAFGLIHIYAHFLGDSHPHKWHTLFRVCAVGAFAGVNHGFLVPQLYIKRRYFTFFTIILSCLVILLVLPDIILPKPVFDHIKFRNGQHLPFGSRVLLFEMAHIYLFFFISTFASIATRTGQYIEQIEQRLKTMPVYIEQQQLPITEIEQKNSAIIEKPIETAFTVTVNYSLIRIEFSDILFIKSMDNYLQFHLKDKKPILVRMTLKEASEKLPTEAFLRIHKSYIVAIAAIESVRNKTILIAKNDIPIGKTYEESLAKFFA